MIDYFWVFFGFFYAVMALVVGVCTHNDNETLPSCFDAPSPWLRGLFWFPVMLVAICLIALDSIAAVAGGARKHRR